MPWFSDSQPELPCNFTMAKKCLLSTEQVIGSPKLSAAYTRVNYTIIPKGFGIIVGSLHLRAQPEGAQRLKAEPKGAMIPQIMPRLEGMIRVHTDPLWNKFAKHREKEAAENINFQAIVN